MTIRARVGRGVVPVAVLAAALTASGVAGATPDNARGCPPGWHPMSTTQPESIPAPVPELGDDVEDFVWSNVTKTEGLATYLGLLDNNANGSLCVRWTWGDRLAEQSSMRREFGDTFDPLYFFVFIDDTSAAP